MSRILGFDILDIGKNDYIKKVLDDFERGKKKVIISGNPEVLNTALKNKDLGDLCRVSDIIPDGIGVVLAGRMTGHPFTEKIAGIEVMEEILKISSCCNIGVYMLGAEDWVVKKAVKECIKRYGARIAGSHDGFFNMENCQDIIEDINKSGAGVLFVAMGCPRQEVFIAKYKDKLNPRILMGVGGSFDVLAGKVNRAPAWMIKMGLEWLYRVSKEPARIVRLISIPAFFIKVMFRNKKYNQ